MRYLVTILMLVVALSAYGREAGYIQLQVVTDTNATKSATANGFNGYIEEIVLDVGTAAATGSLSVVAQSPVSTAPDMVLATNNLAAADVIVRPRIASTMTDGTAEHPTNITYRTKYLCADEDLVFSVSEKGAESVTGKTFNAIIKYIKPD